MALFIAQTLLDAVQQAARRGQVRLQAAGQVRTLRLALTVQPLEQTPAGLVLQLQPIGASGRPAAGVFDEEADISGPAKTVLEIASKPVHRGRGHKVPVKPQLDRTGPIRLSRIHRPSPHAPRRDFINLAQASISLGCLNHQAQDVQSLAVKKPTLQVVFGQKNLTIEQGVIQLSPGRGLGNNRTKLGGHGTGTARP